MNQATAEALHQHSKTCDSREFTLREADDKKHYECRKCRVTVSTETAAAPAAKAA